MTIISNKGSSSAAVEMSNMNLLKPDLKGKVDELFLRWFCDPDVIQLLQLNLKQIAARETPSIQDTRRSSGSSARPGSPRFIRPSTPPSSPTPTVLQSPRSPRPKGKKVHTLRDSQELHTLSSTGRSDNGDLRHSLASLPPGSQRDIPKFYFPMGRPTETPNQQVVRECFVALRKQFEGLAEGKASLQEMGPITKVLDLPVYWKSVVYLGAGGAKKGYVNYDDVTAMWKRTLLTCHDDASRFVRLLSRDGLTHLTKDDLEYLVQDVVDTHPGLAFLQDAPEFHSRYVITVIARIFYTVNRSWSKKITIPELRRSNFLKTIERLDDEEDINQITDYFSYEHFYVIYCKFWELDRDHDLFISKDDLSRHNNHAISSKMVDRIFSGAVSQTDSGRMSYYDFVWFLLSEEDKKTPTSIEYWFRCMDLDGDGYLSLYELEYFYNEQLQKMEALGIEQLPFVDCLCQMLDLVKPKEKTKIALSDIKKCPMTNVFFDTFFNLDKFLDNEQRDPFANQREVDGVVVETVSDWDKFAQIEYEALLEEESAQGAAEEANYTDDFEPDEDGPPPTSMEAEADDLYDFSHLRLT